jgi:hypothetical protein
MIMSEGRSGSISHSLVAAPSIASPASRLSTLFSSAHCLHFFSSACLRMFLFNLESVSKIAIVVFLKKGDAF